MKITKESLKKMIIQELMSSSGFMPSKNDYRLGNDAAGEASARSGFRTTNFEDDVTRIWGLLDDMETIIREDKLLEPRELDSFKTQHLDNLRKKIEFLEGAIDARLSGKFDEVE